MTPAWLHVGWLSLALLVCVGCRTTNNKLLEPPKDSEVLNIPPVDDARYNNAQYPTSALATRDKNRRLYDENIMPAKAGTIGGMGNRPGMGGMGGR